MKIRFALPAAVEAAREDLMRVHYAPGRRPGIPNWRWYLLLALLLLPFAWSAAQALRGAAMMELVGRVQPPSRQVGRPIEVMVTTGVELGSLLAPGRSAQVRLPGRGWVRARVVVVRLAEVGGEGRGGGATVTVWLRLLPESAVSGWQVGDDGAVVVRFSLLQDLRAWWRGWGPR